MSDASINLIGSIRPVEAGNLSPKAPSFALEEASAAQKPASPEQEKPSIPKESVSVQAGETPNISIHFRIDDQTQAVTVFVVDRATKQVLRSIPASELHKLKAGDLLQLTA
jgi:uncharacterized FlaG/YvyC family protein